MSYFGYKRGDISKEGSPDIAAIGTALATGIDTETKRRKDLKTKLEDDNRTSLEKLGEFAKTEDISSNEFLYNGAAASRTEQTAIHQAMIDGKINVEDANRAKLNVMGSWTGLKENVTVIAKRIEDLSKLDGKGNSLQAKALVKALDFKNKKIQHDPKTGKGYIIDDKGEKMLMESIGNLVGKEFDTVDLDGLTTSMTDDVAVFETYQSSTRSTQDSRQQASFETFMDSQIKTGLPTDQSIYSILMDSAGVESLDETGTQIPKSIKVTEITGYDKTGNPITKQKEYKLGPLKLKLNKETGSLEQDGGATAPQRAAAEAIFRSNLEIKLARKSSKQFIRPEKATSGEKIEKDEVDMIDLFVKGGDFTGLKGFLSNNGNLVEVSDDNEKLFFTKKDGVMVTVDLTGSAREVGRSIASLKSAGLAAAYSNKSKSSKTALINPKALEFRKAKFNVQTKLKEGAAKRLEGKVSKDFTGKETTTTFTKDEYLSQVRKEVEGTLQASSINYNNKGELIYTTPGTTIGTVLGKQGDHDTIIENLKNAAVSDVKNGVTPDAEENQAPI